MMFPFLKNRVFVAEKSAEKTFQSKTEAQFRVTIKRASVQAYQIPAVLLTSDTGLCRAPSLS